MSNEALLYSKKGGDGGEEEAGRLREGKRKYNRKMYEALRKEGKTIVVKQIINATMT